MNPLIAYVSYSLFMLLMIEKEAYVRKLYNISLEPNGLEIKSLAWYKHTYTHMTFKDTALSTCLPAAGCLPGLPGITGQ